MVTAKRNKKKVEGRMFKERQMKEELPLGQLRT
jgi:hypothetical protein